MGLLEILKGEQPGILQTLMNYENAGQFGEFATEFALTNHNLSGDLVVLKNLYVPIQGKTSEIDLVMIHEKGIFVFESKNYSGWIFGSANQLNWTQSLKNGQKNSFYNPILQNRTHIKALSNILGKPLSDFTSYVVFSERCSLKKVPEDTVDTIIVRRPDMLQKLRLSLCGASPKYTHYEIQRIVDVLRPFTYKDKSEKQQHIEEIRTKCPFCGNDLVLRHGKYGPFWGCSTYPKCRFTRPNK